MSGRRMRAWQDRAPVRRSMRDALRQQIADKKLLICHWPQCVAKLSKEKFYKCASLCCNSAQPMIYLSIFEVCANFFCPTGQQDQEKQGRKTRESKTEKAGMRSNQAGLNPDIPAQRRLKRLAPVWRAPNLG